MARAAKDGGHTGSAARRSHRESTPRPWCAGFPSVGALRVALAPCAPPPKAQRARCRAHFAAPPGLALHNQDPYAPCFAPQCSLPPHRPCGPKKRSTRATHTEGQAHPRSGNKHRNHPPHTEMWGWRGVGGGLTALIMGFRHADDPAHTSAKWDAPGPTGRGQQKRARPRSSPLFSTRNTPHRLFIGSPRRRREGGRGGSLLARWPLRRGTSRQEPPCWPVRGRAGPCTASRRGLVGTGAGRELK